MRRQRGSNSQAAGSIPSRRRRHNSCNLICVLLRRSIALRSSPARFAPRSLAFSVTFAPLLAMSGLRVRVQLHEPLRQAAATPVAHGLDAGQLSQLLLLLPASEVRTISDFAYRLTRQFGLESVAPHGLLLTMDLSPFGSAGNNTVGHCILPMSEPIEIINNMQLVHCWAKEGTTEPCEATAAAPTHAPAASERKRKRESTIPPASPPPAAVTAAASSSANIAASSAAPMLSKHQRKKQRQREAAAAAAASAEPTSIVPPIATISAVPVAAASASVAAPVAGLEKPKKKQRRGQRKPRSAAMDALQPATQTPVAAVAATPCATPSKSHATTPASARSAKLSHAMDTSDSSSSSSSSSDSDSDSDVQISAPRSQMKPTAAPPVSSSSAAAAASVAPLSRLPKGHFKFTDDADTDPRAASSATANSTAAASSPAAASSLVPVASAPLFFVSSKEHMPREKQQRAQRENGGAGIPPRQKEKRRGKRNGDVQATQTNGDASSLPVLPSKAAVPFDYSAAAVAADSFPSAPAAAASPSADADVSEEQREQEQVSLALETFGEHYIAPRTLKRLGGGAGNSWSAALVKERDAHVAATTAFDSCPPIDLSSVTAVACDVIAYRCLELSSEWTPVLSDYRTVRVTSHDRNTGEIQGQATSSRIDESKEQDASAAASHASLVLRITDLSSPKIVEGPSFTSCMSAWREAQRLEKKKAKWAAKHQHSAVAAASAASATTSSSTPVVAAPNTKPSAVPSRGRPRTSTRFSLMSNVVRALQEKEKLRAQQQAQTTMAATSQHNEAAAADVTANLSTGAAAHAARSPTVASPSPSRSLPPSRAAASSPAPIQSFIIPPSDYHLPSRTSPRPAPAAVSPAPVAAVAATTTASPEPTLSQLEQLIQQKRLELEAKERMQA